jgi:E3 ubiquitin-protein ligase HUWE1
MSTFIHNEPTSLAILQEMGVPQAFLKRIGDGTFPVSAEVAIVIPHAIGALCLNEAGLGQVGEAGVFGKFFGMFKKGEGMVELLENDVPHIVGTSLDELVRHHPGLKDGVLGGIEDLLGFVHEVGKKHKANMFAWTEGDKEELCELFVEGETGVDVEGVRFTKYLECVAKVRREG